jgi:dihydrofolate reductase / thymidylate synthase
MNPCRMFDLIVAINNDGLIGVKEYGEFSIPWPMLSGDMNFFRTKTTITTNQTQVNAIIVGYNTWKTLPNIYKKNTKRLNIIVSRPDTGTENIHGGGIYTNTFENALTIANQNANVDDIYVIGGAAIYDTALAHPLLRTIYLTHVLDTYPKENVVEQKIYFPLNPTMIDKLVDDGFLISINAQKIHDTGKNIFYTIKTFNTTNLFSQMYFSMKKLQRICAYEPGSALTKNLTTGEYQYLNLIKTIMDNGIYKKTRNDITKSIFGYQLIYNLSEGYPLPTVKKSYPKTIFEELMWMVRGQTNVKILQQKNIHIWDKNSSKEYLSKNNLPYDEGDIGPGYGFQMRHYGASYTNCSADYNGQGKDQLKECIHLLNNDPHSRRIIINLWNPTDINRMCLPVCHVIYNFGVDLYDKPNQFGTKGKLNCHLFQRSWDVLLGWNTTTAALLTYILANHCDLDPGILVHSITDAHLYKTHIDMGAVDKLLGRTPRKTPTLKILRKHNNIEDYVFEDLVIENYYPAPSIIAELVA